MLGKLPSGYMDTRKVVVERLGAPCQLRIQSGIANQ